MYVTLTKDGRSPLDERALPCGGRPAADLKCLTFQFQVTNAGRFFFGGLLCVLVTQLGRPIHSLVARPGENVALRASGEHGKNRDEAGDATARWQL